MRGTRRTRGLTIAALTSALVVWAPHIAVRAQQDPDQLEQLVAPIALYPDDLAAEVMAAATYPAQVDEAAHWLLQNGSLTPDQIASNVDRMDWDSSVKGLTEFPVVLTMMDQNLSWTSALGDAYFNQPDDVMEAVQVLRQRAIAAGTLQSNSQVTVITQDGTIVIEPATADTEYVPSYDCWSVFGAPIDPWPEFAFGSGFVAGPHVRWDVSFRVTGQWGRVNWGLHNWGFDWSNHRVNYRRDAYVSHSPSVVDRHYPPRPAPERTAAPPKVESRANPGRPVVGQATSRAPAPTKGEPVRPAAPTKAEPARPEAPTKAEPPRPAAPTKAEPPRPAAPTKAEPPRPAAPTKAEPVRVPAGPKPATPPKAPVNTKSDRGFPQSKPPAPPTGTKSSVFSGINHGGVTSSNASRGQQSMGARPAPPKPAPPPRPAPAPAQGKGRGRGGL